MEYAWALIETHIEVPSVERDINKMSHITRAEAIRYNTSIPIEQICMIIKPITTPGMIQCSAQKIRE
jgi:hypothetical protein